MNIWNNVYAILIYRSNGSLLFTCTEIIIIKPTIRKKISLKQRDLPVILLYLT